MTGRTPLQDTLLGDDAGSVMAWTLYRQGYERGVASGYTAGYDDAMAVLNDAGALLATYTPSKHPTQVELLKRRAVKPGADTRTGAQVVADAAESWGLTASTAQAA